MVEHYRGQFPENRAWELAETAWVSYYHLYASPYETDFQMDAWIWRKCKNDRR